MADDLTELQIKARLAKLYAIAESGVLITRHGDTSVQFRSMDDLLAAIKILEGQLGTAQGKVRSRVSYIRQSTKGYGRSGEEY